MGGVWSAACCGVQHVVLWAVFGVLRVVPWAVFGVLRDILWDTTTPCLITLMLLVDSCQCPPLGLFVLVYTLDTYT